MATLRDKISEIIGEEANDKLDAVMEVITKQPVRAKSTTRYKFEKMPAKKLIAKQPKQLVALLMAVEGLDTFTLDELADKAVKMEMLVTTQEPGRIAAYYKGKLVELGMESIQ